MTMRLAHECRTLEQATVHLLTSDIYTKYRRGPDEHLGNFGSANPGVSPRRVPRTLCTRDAHSDTRGDKMESKTCPQGTRRKENG